MSNIKWDTELDLEACRYGIYLDNRFWTGSQLIQAFKAGAEFQKNRKNTDRPEPLKPSGPGMPVKTL